MQNMELNNCRKEHQHDSFKHKLKRLVIILNHNESKSFFMVSFLRFLDFPALWWANSMYPRISQPRNFHQNLQKHRGFCMGEDFGLKRPNTGTVLPWSHHPQTNFSSVNLAGNYLRTCTVYAWKEMTPTMKGNKLGEVRTPVWSVEFRHLKIWNKMKHSWWGETCWTKSSLQVVHTTE